jgi:hypothetical protein
MENLDQLLDWCKQTFWRRRDHVAESTGTQQAGLPVVLNSLGKLDATILEIVRDGIWTPELKFGGAATGITYTRQVGFYSRIGNLVFVRCFITLSNKGSATGAATIAGLPVAASSIANGHMVGSVYAATMSSMSGHLHAIVAPSASIVNLSQLGTGTTLNLDDTHFTNTTSIILTLVYSA